MQFIRRLFTFILMLATTSCASYSPLSVQTSVTEIPSGNPVIVKRVPALQTADYTVSESSITPGKFYLIPTRIEPIHSEPGKLFAIGLERGDGEHLIFTSVLAPPPKLLKQAKETLMAASIKVSTLEFYPIQQMYIRPITDPRLPGNILFTSTGSPYLVDGPYCILLITQVNSKADVQATKSLLNLENGILLEGSFEILTELGPKMLSAKVVVGNAEVTSITM